MITDSDGYHRLFFLGNGGERIWGLCVFGKVGVGLVTVLLDIMVESGNLVRV